ncbi:nucleosome-remodeling factor subunit BPTF-like isoform X2 [Trichomycterus rosablanca]|uniref:nucleosome-remodeling factor subunit BPTF-like isoform X2 n=1 Tax=Trichomycterus rosablanca TaxID=2290929 RepID=UPI002F3509D5
MMRARRSRSANKGAVLEGEGATPVAARGSRGGRGRGRGSGRGRGIVPPDLDVADSKDEEYQPVKRGSRGGRGSRSRGNRGRGGTGRGGRRKIVSKIVYDDDSDEEDLEAASLQSDDDEDEFLRQSEDDADYEEVKPDPLDDLDPLDDGSDYKLPEEEGSSDSSDTPGRRRPRVHRPQTPIFEEKDIPLLELPKSSDDALVPAVHVLTAASIYEVLRNFSTVLRLSPFRFEDFCAALSGEEQCTLLAETHISLLKAILREEDSSNTCFGPSDLKDSVNSTLYFMDGMTWPAVLRAYCESDPEYHHVLSVQDQEGFPNEPLESKLKVLQFLVDQFLATSMAREELMSEGVVTYDDHCRVCHHLGDLLCCETCSAVYHLECVKPPLLEVPEEEWQCEVCVAHRVPGVGDSVTESQKTRPYIRHEPIGFDRHRRKYWFLNRRIIVEEDGDHENKTIWYYSTKVQLAELLSVLDEAYWEKQLSATLEELRDEVHAHMDITEELTNKARGNNKCYLAAANEEILEHERAKREKEMEEVKKKAAEELERSKKEGEEEQQSIAEQESESTTDKFLLAQTGTEEPTCPAEAPCDSECLGSKTSGSSVTSVFPLETPSDASSTLSETRGGSGLQELPETADKSSDLDADVGGVSSSPPTPQAADENSRSSLKDDFDASISSQDEKGEGTEKGEMLTGVRGPLSATRMVTRLRNPESKLSLQKSHQVASAIHEANKEYKEGKEVIVINAQGEVARLNSRCAKDPVMKGSLGSLFRLGQEGRYRVYQNQYSTNTLALNKHQHREDHDKRRHLSHKFCFTAAGEFKWNGAIYGSKMLIVSTLRLTIIQLENNIPAPFLHPNWDSHRSNWSRAVQMCSKAREFALALAILECSIKPVAMLPMWKDSLGHTRLHRITSLEREEKEKVRKREKKLEEEETMQQATWVKYTFRVKHQVWKQKGEEYRVTGYGGWCWISKTYVHRFNPKLPGNTNANYRQHLEARNNIADSSTTKNYNASPEVSESDKSEKDEKKSNELKQEEEEMTTEASGVDIQQNVKEAVAESKGDASSENTPIKNEDGTPMSEQRPFNYDVVDVSEGFLLRTAYKQKVKAAKLDELLEHRVRQQDTEAKQKKTANSASPKVVIQRLKFKMEPHGVVATIRPEEKPEVRNGIVSQQESAKGNQQTSTQVNNVLSTEENGVGCGEQDSEGKTAASNTMTETTTHPNSPQLNGQDERKSVSNELPSKDASLHLINDRGIENDIKPLSLKEALKPLLNGSTVLNSDTKRTNSTEVTERNPDYLPPQKVPRLGDTVEDLALSSPTIPKAESTLDTKEHTSLKKRLDEEDKGSQATIVPSPVLSTEESSLSNDFVESHCNNGSNLPSSMVTTQVTTTTVTATSTESQPVRKNSVGSINESITVTNSTVTSTTAPVQGEETKPNVTHLLTESSSQSPDPVALLHSTRDRVQLVRFSSTKKVRSESALPSHRKFVTKSCKKSIFVLPSEDLKKLALKGGFKEVPLFSYNAKPAPDVWPYTAPRPTFGITWRYRLQTANSLAGTSLMLHLLWACLRWDDMAVKPSNAGTTRTETTETEITTTEIIKRRDVGPYGIRSEYCIRKIICPIGVPETPKETCTPQRKGLRSSALRPKPPEPSKQEGPIIIETWVPEEELLLWEIRAFAERVEREKAQVAEQARVSARRKAMELQQQKRLEQKQSTASTPSSTPGTPSTPKTAVSITSQVIPAGKVVLATKLGTPITFQQNKNFQQTFATWVQGQVSSSTVTSVSTTTGQTFQISGSPVSVAGKVIPLPANSKIVTLSVPTTQGGVQQKVVGIIPSGTTGNKQITIQPSTTTVNITPKVIAAAGVQLRPGVTILQAPAQQGAAVGKTIIRTPIVVQQGQAGKVVTQIIQGQSATPGSPAGGTHVGIATSQTSASPRPSQGPIKLALSQPGVAADRQQGGGQGVTVMVQGQGQTAGQLQVIPHGVTVIPTGGQQLMQAVLPNGQVRRFLFTPAPVSSTIVPSAAASNALSTTTGQSQPSLKICAPTPAQPVQAAALAPRTPPMTPKAQVPIQSATPLQAKTTVNKVTVKQQQTQVKPQVQLQQGAQVITVPGLQLQQEQTVKVQLPIQIQQQAGTKPQEIQNVVTLQTASVQEQLQRIQQLREQQQQKKRQQQEAKREQQQLQQTGSQSNLIQKQVVMKQNAMIEQLKQKKTMTPEEREENQRMIVCNQVMKFILDKIDKDERQAAKKRKQEETMEQKRSKQTASKLSALLHKHKEQLKAEILRKRVLLDKRLQLEVQEELRQDLARIHRERAQQRVQATAATTATQVTTTYSTSAYKRKHEDEGLAKSKKKKMISTTSRESKKDTKLYCICRTPYDETKFYIGCDLCTNWYHGDCVGITEKQAKKMDDYICAECKRAQEGSTEELFCICRTPYDDSQFYIGCDRCQNWYHGRCVGILQSEATYIDEYICPQCQSTEDAMTVLTPLTEKDYEGLRRILRSLQAHKMAWPFLDPVDPEDAPDYYRVIKEPMDLSTMEERLLNHHYSKLTEYVADMTKIFDNCRYYNPSDSSFYQCAEVLETFFVQKLKAFKASRL